MVPDDARFQLAPVTSIMQLDQPSWRSGNQSRSKAESSLTKAGEMIAQKKGGD